MPYRPYALPGDAETPAKRPKHWIMRDWPFVVMSTLSLVLWIIIMIEVMNVPFPLYEYRLASPDEAKVLVNEQGWRVSQRMRPTDTLVYLYHRQ